MAKNKESYHGNCGNKDNFQKSKLENSRKGKYDNKYDNKPTNDRLKKDEVTELIKDTIKCPMHQNLQKDVKEVKPETSSKTFYCHLQGYFPANDSRFRELQIIHRL